MTQSLEQQATIRQRLDKSAFLLGLAWSILREQREMLSHYERKDAGSDSHHEAFAAFEKGIEELFYSNKEQ